MVAPRPETKYLSERRQHEGRLAQARIWHSSTELGSTSRRSHLAGGQATTVVLPDAPPRCEPILKTERVLILDFTST
jgi:hypothetical protein